MGEEWRGESWDGVGEHVKAPASEGGRYKGKPKSRVPSKLGVNRSDCATWTTRGNILVWGRGCGCKSGGEPPHSKLG